MLTIIDLNAEAAKLTTSDGPPATTTTKRKGRVAHLGAYRDGILILGTSTGTGPGHWETHPADELVWVLEGSTVLDIVEDDGPRSYTIGAGMLVIVPPGIWHRFHSADGATTMSVVVPGENIDLDVDDPRRVERAPA